MKITSNNGRVAVIIPVYGARYLGQALESAIVQLRPPDEVIVVDDGSPDPAAVRHNAALASAISGRCWHCIAGTIRRCRGRDSMRSRGRCTCSGARSNTCRSRLPTGRSRNDVCGCSRHNWRASAGRICSAAATSVLHAWRSRMRPVTSEAWKVHGARLGLYIAPHLVRKIYLSRMAGASDQVLS
jgi:hypothetical protein